MGRSSLLSLIVGIAALLPGCAVVQPHIEMPPVAADAARPLAGGLGEQLAIAQTWQSRYLDAVADQTLLTNSLAMAAIPASAAALAVGIVNPAATTTREVLVATGAGTAAALGLGAFLIDRRRDAVYYNGAMGIYCLTVAVAPVAIESTEYQQMVRDVDELRSSLADAAAAGVSADVIDRGNEVYAAGRTLIRAVGNSGASFANELRKINIVVNSQIGTTDRSINDITAAITAIRTNTTSIMGSIGPGVTTQGGRAPASSAAAARLRRSVELVSSWVKVYQGAVAATEAKLRALQCVSPAGAVAGPAQPIVIVTGGQTVSTSSIGADGVAGTVPVITVQPPPPPLRRSSASPSGRTGQPPVSDGDLPKLRAAFGLSENNAPSINAPAFRAAVRSLQKCLGMRQDGALTPDLRSLALANTDRCLTEVRAGEQPSNPTPQPPPPGTPR